MQRDVTRMSAQAVFPKVNSLPRAERQPAFAHRNAQVHRRKRRADVRRHVIIALQRVFKKRITVWDEPLKNASKSRRASGLAFSWINSEADVCCKCMVNNPSLKRFSLTHASTWRVKS
jgi:hypothetical protein